MKQVFVSPKGSQWKVQSIGTRKAAGLFDKKSEAMKKATQVAKNQKAELIVQKQDGKIQLKNSFGNDPFPPKG